MSFLVAGPAKASKTIAMTRPTPNAPVRIQKRGPQASFISNVSQLMFA
jgi:hypothetical protein